MSLGILALKIGLVVGVTGVSIATPIFLSRKGVFSSGLENVHSSETSSGMGNADGHNSDTEISHPSSSGIEEAQGVRGDAGSQGQISTVSSEAPSLDDSFKKRCFVVPAKSKGNENIQLLTCFGSENAGRSSQEGDQPEYDSEFHIFDPSRNKGIPLKVEGKISWEPSNNQISVQMSKDSVVENEYSFKSEGNGWNRVSAVSAVLSKEECSIFEITSQDSPHKGTFWLSCGDNTSEDFDANSPTAIPLTSWPKAK
ncbi:hypothetical protein WEN_02210 [Mycoplasma wenyonii str. Massachusetts]|uniref:Uncharacterized protein n=1 Tax=Mycoplasma wenyonii (strain Massachusetts) TaxID=1197325 RepID=I6YLP1_MYCWM|nr:hypothetical protein [Mycoplasma wenyonii]AFN65229.1 hypothetical protein WEN_02210 [Mycoplasma wenyonii str. Massachusetts]